MRTAWLLLALSLLFPRGADAQNIPIPALPFLDLPSSPSISAMGGAGVALPSSDPHAFLYNPAHLGVMARDTRAAGTFYPGGSTDWLAIGDLAAESAALTAGVDLRPLGAPLVAGIGLGQTALRFGERVLVDGEGIAVGAYEPRDRYRALSVSAATTGAARLSLGASVRHVTTADRAIVEDGEVVLSQLQGFTFDVGVLAQADVTRLAGQPAFGTIQPEVSIAIGYAQSNIGGRVAYSGQLFPSALPRTARLGWSASAGLSVPFGRTRLALARADLSVQAEHLLVRQAGLANYTYEPFLGNLNVVQNGFLGRGSQDVTGRRGVRVTLLETVALSRGGFDGWGFDEGRTRGFEVHLSGPLKLLGEFSGNDQLLGVAERYDLRFTYSSYFAGAMNQSTFTGVSFIVRR